MADEKTSPETARKASRVLRDSSASPDAKSAAASALSQADDQRSEVGDQKSVRPLTQGLTKVPEPRTFVFAPLDPTHDEKGRERKQSPVVEFANGQYYRKFKVEDQPFAAVGMSHTEGEGEHARTVYDVTPDEEVQILLKDGHFVEVGNEPGTQS